MASGGECHMNSPDLIITSRRVVTPDTIGHAAIHIRNGIITGFHARVAAEVVGLELLAFILVAWSDPKVEAKFLDKIQKTPNVLECHHVTGAWNYLLKVRVKNTRELETVLAGTVKSVAGVLRTDTMIALSSVKEGWSIPV